MHGTSALWVAADRGHAHTVQALVGAKANVHQACVRGRTPLFVAAKRGHRDVVQFLLQHGVVVDEAGKYERTPAWVAAHGGHIDVLTDLVWAKASLEIPGGTGLMCPSMCRPLWASASRGDVDVVQALVFLKAVIDNSDAEKVVVVVDTQHIRRRPFDDGGCDLTCTV